MLLETAVEAELAAEAEHVLLELAALLNAEVSVTQIILQALEARIVGLKKVVGLHRLLVARWVRGCARLMLVHSDLRFCGPGSGVVPHRRGHFLSDYFILPYYIASVYIMW
jgi:hypothetical protein